MASDWKKLLQALIDAGFDVERSGRDNHLRASLNGGKFVTLPHSPSDYRALQNALRDLRRYTGFVWRPKQTRTPRAPREEEHD